MSLLLTELNKMVNRNIEQIKMLHKNYSTEIIINGENQSSNQIDYFLKEVKITNIPTENVWIFESEKVPNECLKGGGKAVERTIIFLQHQRLFVLMFELKSKPKDCKKLKDVKKKFECSLVHISTFLTGNEQFTKLAHTQIFPVGILCFNKPDCNLSPRDQSEICKRFAQFQENQTEKGTIFIEPITFDGRIRIPTLFFKILIIN